MALRVRFQYSQGASLGYSIERLADAFSFDFNDATFKNTTPTTPVQALTAGTGSRAGVYAVTLASTPQAQFANGDYAVYINNLAAANVVIGILGVVMYNGDDTTVVPSGAGADPWATALPGSYAAGTAGYEVGHLVTGVDTPGTTTLLGRLTTARAGWLDNLAAGPVALAAQIPAGFVPALFASPGVLSVDALQNAPSGGGGGTSDWTNGERNQIRYRLGIDGTTARPAVNAPAIGLGDIVGTVPVDHNYGAAGALRFLDRQNQPVENGFIHAYRLGDYLASARGREAVRGETTTDSAGNWRSPFLLDPGVYVLLFWGDGAPAQSKTITV